MLALILDFQPGLFVEVRMNPFDTQGDITTKRCVPWRRVKATDIPLRFLCRRHILAVANSSSNGASEVSV